MSPSIRIFCGYEHFYLIKVMIMFFFRKVYKKYCQRIIQTKSYYSL